jgi:hypothetical protein
LKWVSDNLKNGEGIILFPHLVYLYKKRFILRLKRLQKIKKIKDDGRIVYYYLIKRKERQKDAGASLQSHDRRMGDDFFQS